MWLQNDEALQPEVSAKHEAAMEMKGWYRLLPIVQNVIFAESASCGGAGVYQKPFIHHQILT